MKYDKKEIIKLKEAGETYVSIAQKLGCSEWTVKYHLSPNRKRSCAKYAKKIHPLSFKLKRFLIKGTVTEKFGIKELKSKIGDSPVCEITGEPIDLMDAQSYSLDHTIPLSRGGKSCISNLSLVKREINQAKFNLTKDEFIQLCKRVLNGSPTGT